MDFAKRNAEAVQILAQQLVEARQDRNAIIEECARVAENDAYSLAVDGGMVSSTIAAAIRALKDKS